MPTLTEFYNSVLNETDKYYVFVGHPDKNYNPTNLANDLLLAKRISTSDIIKAIKRNDWSYGQTYTQYNKTAYDSGTLRGTDFYVSVFVGGVYKIFKCINNNNGSPSVISPSVINRYGVVTLDDGYSWVYMYQITTATFDKFNTFDYIPFVADPSTPSFAIPNSIDNIQMTSKGFGYTYCNVIITGDGSDAAAVAEIENSMIKRVTVTSLGTGYTTATVSFIGDGVGASAVPVLAPSGGHGANTEAELYCNSLLVSTNIDSQSDIETLPYGVGYSKYGILKNITLENDIGDLKVNYVDVLNNGTGYSLDEKPTVSFSGGFTAGQITAGTAQSASGYPSMDNDSVSRIVLTSNGKNYTSTPSFSITGGSGSGTQFNVVMCATPIRCFKSINVLSVNGTFRKNEIIKQNNTTAKVLFHDQINNVIGVYDINGTFQPDLSVEGVSSGAYAITRSSNVLNSPDMSYNDSNLFALYNNTTITRQEYQSEKINIALVF